MSRLAASRSELVAATEVSLTISGSGQVAAEALDAPARLLQVFGLGRIRDAESRPETEGRTLHHRYAFGLQQLGDEVLIGNELVAGRRGTADGPRAGRIDVERTLGLGA